MYSSLQIAKKFLELAKAEGEDLTPMQLLKLVYIAHGCMLAIKGKPLISDQIQAWKYGPVIPDLYHKIKQYGGNPVRHISVNSVVEYMWPKFSEEATNLIQKVYTTYGKKDGITLSALTHAKDTPWDVTWNSGHEIISNELIEHHYRQKLNAHKAKTKQASK